MRKGEHMNQAVIWLLIFLVLTVIEIATMGLTTIWFAGGALVAGIAAMFGAPVFVQIILFFAVSVILLIFTRPVAVRYFNGKRLKTNVESLIGKTCVVTGAIDNVAATGQATVDGVEWTARSADDALKIPEGTVAEVVEVRGVKLIVSEKKKEDAESSGEKE